MSLTSSASTLLDTTPESILNFRDVGRTVNGFLGKEILKEGILYRSARLDDASPKDRHLLKDIFGIKKVLDLRSRSEVVPRSDNLPLQIPSITHLSIPLPTLRHKLFLLLELSFLQLLTLFWCLFTGGSLAAKEFLSQTILIPWGLTRLTVHGLAHSSPEITQAIRTLLPPHSSSSASSLSTSPEQPSALLIHCAQGKDRTGLIITLLLLLLHIPVPAIDYDYRLSDSELNPERAEKLAGLTRHGLSLDFARTAEGLVEEMDRYLNEEFGGIEEYFIKGGMTIDEIELVGEALLVKGDNEP